MLFRWALSISALFVSLVALGISIASWFRVPSMHQKVVDDTKFALAGISALEERFMVHIKSEAGRAAREKRSGDNGEDKPDVVVGRVRGPDGIVRPVNLDMRGV